jgi:N-acyl-phosphatidylethanolamine-hydrolysing phospholipase D
VKRGNRFANLHPHAAHGLLDVLRWQLGLGPEEKNRLATGQLPRYAPQFSTPEIASAPPPEIVRLTWIGHSTFLVQHRGRNILTDPIFGDCQPLPMPRLRRAALPGIAFDALPEIHDVLISHNHYDHLDEPTVRRLGNQPGYWLPRGLAPWFQRRGIKNCRELDWWQSASLSQDLEIHCVPAQHFSARSPFDRNRTLWCGWILRSATRTVYFAGDTGYCPVFREIGARFGGVDLALLPIGSYCPRWLMQPMHADPFDAVQIHLDLRSRQSVAAHWGPFPMTDEPLSEPPALLRQALTARGVPPEQFRVLRFGETITV